MVLISHEDLMTSNDPISWEINGGQHVVEDPSKLSCQRLWEILNSKTANTIIILATILEGFIILAELLINLRIVQDPYSQVYLCNCLNSSGENQQTSVSSSSSSSSSRNLRIANDIFNYTSITILALFLFEVLLRILSGRRSFLRQTAQVCDGVVVVVAFSLDLIFFVSSIDKDHTTDGKVAAVFIVLLRLWRISTLVKIIAYDAKRGMSHIINAYKRDKVQAEHKVEILILKVEDLEHEVAYLKEKLKKTEKEAVAQKRRRTRDFDGSYTALDASLHSLTNPDAAPWRSSLNPVLSLASLGTSTTPCATPPPPPLAPPPTAFSSASQTPIETSPSCRSKSPRGRRRKSHDAAELQGFPSTCTTVESILQSASIELDTMDEEDEERRRGQRVEQHDSGRGSSYTPGSTPRVTTLKRVGSSGRQSPLYTAPIDEKYDDVDVPQPQDSDNNPCPEEDGQTTENVSGGGGGQQLDELSEIERVKKIEFHLQEDDSKDIPVTAL